LIKDDHDIKDIENDDSVDGSAGGHDNDEIDEENGSQASYPDDALDSFGANDNDDGDDNLNDDPNHDAMDDNVEDADNMDTGSNSSVNDPNDGEVPDEELPKIDKAKDRRNDYSNLAYGVENKGADSQIRLSEEASKGKLGLSEKDGGGGNDQSIEDNSTDERADAGANSGVSGTRGLDETAADSAATREMPKSQTIPNPFASNGDLQQQWHRRLRMIDTIDDDQKTDIPKGIDRHDQTDKTADYSASLFAMDTDDLKETADQVLGAAQMDEAKELPVDNEAGMMDSESQPDFMEEDDLKVEHDVESGKKRKRSSDAEQSNKLPSNRKSSLMEEEVSEDLMASTDVMVPPRSVYDMPVIAPDAINSFVLNAENHVDDTNHQDDVFVYDEANRGRSNSPANVYYHKLWQDYRMQTESHSTRLCEELRLILEPTLKTRLQGDYRTGKRINMRKVIGYVASGFRKDKIWLRRTKPAKRNYRILILIDDSKSMAVAGSLALLSLTTIANALTRLEVGDICIGSFADRVQVIHPFGGVFDDEAGSRLLSQFHFQANSTSMGEALHSAMGIFRCSTAPMSSSSSDIMQLCFIVSDARIDSDDRLRIHRMTRDMIEENILPVLLIVDHNEDGRDSILNTRTVEFIDGKVKTSSYLDNFPFPLYLLVQHIENLPNVFSDAIKQWFDSIRQTREK
jgi:midasin